MWECCFKCIFTWESCFKCIFIWESCFKCMDLHAGMTCSQGHHSLHGSGQRPDYLVPQMPQQDFQVVVHLQWIPMWCPCESPPPWWDSPLLWDPQTGTPWVRSYPRPNPDLPSQVVSSVGSCQLPPPMYL